MICFVNFFFICFVGSYPRQSLRLYEKIGDDEDAKVLVRLVKMRTRYEVQAEEIIDAKRKDLSSQILNKLPDDIVLTYIVEKHKMMAKMKNDLKPIDTELKSFELELVSKLKLVVDRVNP